MIGSNMHSSTLEPPVAEVILRVRMANALSAEDLGSLSEIAKGYPSLDDAIVKALQAGIKVLKRRGGKSR